MTRILMTGGRGFIGTALANKFEEDGHVVTHFDRVDGKDVTLGKDPLIESINAGECERVVHLAGVLGTHELFDTPHEAVDVNIKGAINVLQACAETGAGLTQVTLPYAFPSVYRYTKETADEFAYMWHREFGVPVSIVVAYNVFGPGQKYGEGHPQKFLPTWATLAWQNKPLPIWGDGENRLDMVSTADLAQVFAYAIEEKGFQFYDAGCSQTWTVNQVADMVLEYTGSTAGKEYLPMRRGETPTMAAATGQGWEKFPNGWCPTFKLEEFHAAIDTYK